MRYKIYGVKKWQNAGTSFGLIVCLLSCQNNSYHRNASHAKVDDASIEKGEVLAKAYCQSCHQLPDPSLLSADKWNNGVLPQMGPRLGIFYYGYAQYPSAVNDPNIGEAFYPSQPVLSFVDWQHIIDYYTALSPDSLQASKSDVPIPANNQLFMPVEARQGFTYNNPMTGCLYAPDNTEENSLFVTDMIRKNIVSVNQHLQPIDSVSLRYPVVNLVQTDDTLYVASIGVLTPNDGRSGTIQRLIVQKGHFTSLPLMLADSLRRPVHIDVADIDNDGQKDILVCEFGNLKGALSWLQNKGNNNYRRSVLRNEPGAIATVIRDDNGDGLPDLYVLFAQGDEQIVHFINKGSGRFKQEQLLRFPPAYGSSYFEMKDMNNDGFEDILYTCGDNADYSIELKPYHGVYLFTNDGHHHFTQSFFFHINGCFKAMAEDFDNDGDQDMAAISFFADYQKRPEEGFVYLENKGNNRFDPFSIPAAINGRWLTMEVADVDADGKKDIVLGNFSAPSFTASAIDWKKQPAFLLLKNTIP